MNKDKLMTILEGVIITVLGVLIAVFGISATIDIYFGVTFLVIGVALAVVAIVGLVKSKVLLFGPTFMACALITLGSALFTEFLSFAGLIAIIVFLLIGLGGALVIYGVYTLLKKNLFYGVGQIVVGAALIALSIVYLLVPDFQTVFWIIVGILVAIYGVLVIVSAFLAKGKK